MASSHFTCEASAPGKLILFGEHAVVHGATAVAGALSDLRIFARVELDKSPRLRITIPDIRPGAAARSSFSHEWPVAALDAAVGAHVRCLRTAAGSSCAAAEAPHKQPLQPVADTVNALEAALAGLPGPLVKGLMPPLFLAATVLQALLLPGDGPVRADGIAGAHLTIHKATLPIAAGLGSSAAFSVATAAALVEAADRLEAWSAASAAPSPSAHSDGGARAAGSAAGSAGWHPNEAFLSLANRWAYASEMLFHGSPSGLDNSVATYGGAIAYRREPGTAAVHMSPIAGMPALRVAVTNTKVPKETSKLVAGVRQLKVELPAVVTPIIDAINGISTRVLDAIAEHAKAKELGSSSASSAPAAGAGAAASASATPASAAALHAELSRLARINHSLLNALGVGHEALDGVARASASRGFVTKLTGAGGGGCALTLLPPSSEGDAEAAAAVASFADEMRSHGYDCFETTLGGAGVLIHE